MCKYKYTIVLPTAIIHKPSQNTKIMSIVFYCETV